MEDYFTFVGPKSHTGVVERYANADAFVLPCQVLDNGDRDGIPNVIQEAMAMGLPVISTTVSGIPEVVENEVSGLLVQEKDPLALAEAIERLMDDPALADRLSDEARRKVAGHFDWRETNAPLVELHWNNLMHPEPVSAAARSAWEGAS